MSDKRGIIKNIKPVFCRFDMDDEPERRAWQIIQKLSKGNGEGKNRSYNSIISEAVVGYYDKVTMSHEELLERLEQVIRKEVAAILGVPVQMPSPYPAAQPQQTGLQQEQIAPKTEELNEAALDFMDGFMGM